MNTINISEVQLYSINKNVNKQLVIKLIVNPIDYSQQLEDLLYDSSLNKKTFAAVFAEFQSEEVKLPTIWEKRAKLAWLMIRYWEKENTDINDIIQKLYNKHKITSRTQLTEIQLDEEIKSYQAWLQY